MEIAVKKDKIMIKSQMVRDLILDTYETNDTVKTINNRIDLSLDQIVEQEGITKEQMCDIIIRYTKYEISKIVRDSSYESVNYLAALFRFLDYMDDRGSIDSYLKSINLSFYIPLCRRFNYNYGFEKSIHEYFATYDPKFLCGFCSFVGEIIDAICYDQISNRHAVDTIFEFFDNEPDYITRKCNSKIFYYPLMIKSTFYQFFTCEYKYNDFHITDKNENILKMLMFNPESVLPIKYKYNMELVNIVINFNSLAEFFLSEYVLFGSIDGFIKFDDKYYAFNPTECNKFFNDCYDKISVDKLKEGDIVFVDFITYRKYMKTNRYIPITD
jgi:hypothetical protein